MTEPYRRPRQPYGNPPAPDYDPTPPQWVPTPPAPANLACAYTGLRQGCIDLEELIHSAADGAGFNEEDLKRLDKAVTVMKVAFKLVKKVLGRHGLHGLKPKSVSSAGQKSDLSAAGLN